MRLRAFILALISFSALLPLELLPLAAAKPSDAKIKLVVLVYFDQMRGDYLTRWGELFGEGGFRRLEKEGAWFQNCHYPYAATFTAVGHASAASGRTPRSHGIVGNEWYDRAAGETVYCVDSARASQVPPAESSGKKREKGSSSPERFVGETLADWLKNASPKSRVVALSLKDRSAILPAGRKPDACYWFSTSLGGFITSTFYRDRLHSWVEEFNRTMPADVYFRTSWERLRPDVDYDKHSGPDDGPGESIGILQGKTFPHRLDAGMPKASKPSREAALNSPYGNELLMKLAKRAVAAEKLGHGEAPDFLSLSFSSNDIVGHYWGPDSHEVLDITLRSDLIVKELLGYLDEQVGRGKYALVLTADHGVCPLPESAASKALGATRISQTRLVEDAEAFLAKAFPTTETSAPRFIEDFQNCQFYLRKSALTARKLESARVEAALADWLRKQPFLQVAFTRTQLLAEPLDDVPFLRQIRESYFPERSGDVVVIPKPYDLFFSFLTGTSHGSPHPYDTHVPLLVFGSGIKTGTRNDLVSPLSAAPILSRLLGVKPPETIATTVPTGLFSD